MPQYMIKYLVTGTSDTPLQELLTAYDPLLLDEMNLVLSSMLGGTCTICLEQVELVDVEEIEDDEEEDDEDEGDEEKH